jgi:hypothetical protein
MAIDLSGWNNFVAGVKHFITETEADVVALVVKIKNEEEVIAADLAAAQKWIAANSPAIASDIQGVLKIVEAIGVGANPEVAIAITAANDAVTALNAFAAASNSGAGAAQAVVKGYVAVKKAQSASSAAAAAAITAPSS